jgi:hypothetical protein
MRCPEVLDRSSGQHFLRDRTVRPATSRASRAICRGLQCLGRSAALEDKPGASLRFIDPGFEQARAGDIAKFVAQCMSLTHVSAESHFAYESNETSKLAPASYRSSPKTGRKSLMN